MWKKSVHGLKQNDEGAQSRQLPNLFKVAILVYCRAQIGSCGPAMGCQSPKMNWQ